MQRHRTLFIFMLMTFLLSLNSSCRSAKVGSSLQGINLSPRDVYVVAHRANTGDSIYPENSAEAIRACIDIGVDIIEIDVRETLDGELVVMHDKTVDRTTNGHGAVDQLTWRAIKALKLVNRGSITPYSPISLEEALLLAKGKIMVDLDVKVSTEASFLKIAHMIKRLGLQHQVFVFLYQAKDLEPMSSILEDITLMPRARSIADMAAISTTNITRIVHIDGAFYNTEVMQQYRSQGYMLWMNTLGQYDQQERQNKDGFAAFLAAFPAVNIIQTDFSAQLIIFLKNKGLRGE